MEKTPKEGVLTATYKVRIKGQLVTPGYFCCYLLAKDAAHICRSCVSEEATGKARLESEAGEQGVVVQPDGRQNEPKRREAE